VDDAIEEALLGVVDPARSPLRWLQPNKLRIDEIRCARLLAAILKRRAMPLTALSGNMTLPTCNRLVAGELEARWNQALARVADVESKIVAHEAASPAPTIDPAALASWERTSRWSGQPDDRRTVEEAHRAHADPRGRGRYRRRCFRDRYRRPLDRRRSQRDPVAQARRGQRNSTSADIIAAVAQLALIASDDLIAGLLNRNGLKPAIETAGPRTRHLAALASSNPGVQGHREWHRALAQSLRRRTPIEGRAQDPAVGGGGRRDRGEPPLPDGPWIFARATLATDAAESIVNRARRNARHPADQSGQQSLFPQ